MIYLLHFSRPVCPTRPTRHYLGWTNDLDQRIREHRQGKGARLTQVACERGITLTLAEVWQGDRKLERQLKRLKNSPRLCPICQR